MALSKVDYNSLNVTAAASKALKWNSGADGFETGDIAGAMVLLETQTASSSATLSFTSGIDSTYDTYVFKFINIHPQTDAQNFQVNFRDGSTAYDATKTSTAFQVYNVESDGGGAGYTAGEDLAQGTGVQPLLADLGNDNDQNACGELWLFNPASTTFVKHYMSEFSNMLNDDYMNLFVVAGYCNVTAAIDGVQFAPSAGTIDAGTFKMYGVT